MACSLIFLYIHSFPSHTFMHSLTHSLIHPHPCIGLRKGNRNVEELATVWWIVVVIGVIES
jgi:hypothetical protein